MKYLRFFTGCTFFVKIVTIIEIIPRSKCLKCLSFQVISELLEIYNNTKHIQDMACLASSSINPIQSIMIMTLFILGFLPAQVFEFSLWPKTYKVPIISKYQEVISPKLPNVIYKFCISLLLLDVS